MDDPVAGAGAKTNSLSGLLRHSLIYSLVPVLGRVLSILLVPFYTAWLAPSQYGLIEINDVVLIALQQALGQNLLGGMTRFYFEQKDERERGALVSSSAILLAGLAWLACGLAFVFREPLAPILLARGDADVPASELPSVLGLTLLMVPFQLSSLSGFYYLQVLGRSKAYSLIQLCKITLELSLKIWFIAGLGLGVPGYLLAVLIGEALTSLLLGGWMLGRVGLHLDWSVMRPVLAYSAPLIPVGLCQLGIHQLDRRLLEMLSPAEQALTLTGIYGLGYKVGNLVNAMLLSPFLQIWQPWIYAVRDERERAELLARVSSYAVLAFGALSMAVMLFGKEAVALLDSSNGRYAGAYRVVPWVATGYVFWSIYQTSVIALYVRKRTWILFFLNLAGLAFNIGANLWLVPKLHEIGSALATLATFALLAVLVMLAAHRIAGVRFELPRIGLVLGCVLASGALALWIDTPSSAGGPGWTQGLVLGVKSAALACAWLAFWRWALRTEERRRFVEWLRARLRFA